MCKKVKLINHDCLPILMLLYIMLCIMLAYLMLFAALSNDVCLHNAFFFSFCYWLCKCFFFSSFVLVCWHIVCSFKVWFSIMRSAFNLLVLPNSMSTPFYVWKGYVLSAEIALKNNHYYYYHYPKFLPTSTLTIFTILVNQHIIQVTSMKQVFWKLLMICSFLLTKATYLY